MPAGGTPVIVGSGFTVIATDSWLFVFGIEAINSTCIGDVIPDGAVYVVVAPDAADSDPHADPLHDEPENAHAT